MEPSSNAHRQQNNAPVRSVCVRGMAALGIVQITIAATTIIICVTVMPYVNLFKYKAVITRITIALLVAGFWFLLGGTFSIFSACWPTHLCLKVTNVTLCIISTFVAIFEIFACVIVLVLLGFSPISHLCGWYSRYYIPDVCYKVDVFRNAYYALLGLSLAEILAASFVACCVCYPKCVCTRLSEISNTANVENIEAANSTAMTYGQVLGQSHSITAEQGLENIPMQPQSKTC